MSIHILWWQVWCDDMYVQNCCLLQLEGKKEKKKTYKTKGQLTEILLYMAIDAVCLGSVCVYQIIIKNALKITLLSGHLIASV